MKVSIQCYIRFRNEAEHFWDNDGPNKKTNDEMGSQGQRFLCLKNENIMEGLFSNRKEYTYLPIYLPAISKKGNGTGNGMGNGMGSGNGKVMQYIK